MSNEHDKNKHSKRIHAKETAIKKQTKIAKQHNVAGYDSKAGQEDYMLQNLAPFIAADTSIKWRGEDGAMWANVFDGTQMLEKVAKVVWE